MLRYRFLLNLQQFAVDNDGVDNDDILVEPKEPTKGKQPATPPAADDDDYGDDIEIDFSDDDEDEDDSEEADEDDSDDDQNDETPPPADQSKGNNPTAAAVIAERKKWQEKLRAAEAQAALAQKIMKQAGVSDAAELDRRLDALEAQKLKQQGVPDEVAAALVLQQRQLADMQTSLRKQKYDGEAERLKQDAFFADIDDHRDELEQIAEKTGLSLEQAYRAIHGARRMTEREAEIEARVKANRGKRTDKAVNTTQSGTSKQKSSKSLGLTPDQMAAAKHGVKRGIFKSVEEYAKYAKR